MMSEYDLLPIGSIVKIWDDNAAYMIVGRIAKNEDKIYDYVLVGYPVGLLIETDNLYVNRDNIKELLFLGNVNYTK